MNFSKIFYLVTINLMYMVVVDKISKFVFMSSGDVFIFICNGEAEGVTGEDE
jgi:hypothetical protein